MQPVRGLTAALNGKGRFRYKPPEAVVDFLVVGGGVVGLAIAQRLSQRFPNHSMYLVERHSRAGEETSSEVIHSGLYYPIESLKTRLCLRGRYMLYDRCKTHRIPHRKIGKIVVARASQQSYVEKLYSKSLGLEWPPHSAHTTDMLTLPTKLLSGAQARALEPELSSDIVTALLCPETGIIDSHSLIESLEKEIIDSDRGELVYSTRVVRIDPYRQSNKAIGIPNVGLPEHGWVVQTITGDGGGDAILARTLVNAAGLSSPLILNSILPEQARIPMYYARGSYASYNGPGISGVSRLIYPCPSTGEKAHAFQSLGTHLTLDMQGKVRFGPDIEWISPPSVDDIDDADFWMKHLIPDESRLPEMHRAIMEYLPNVTLDGMQPDYVGIRPKLVPPPGGFQDFVFRTDYSAQVHKSKQHGVMISLLGIESPGLTSSLAIAELVVEDMLGAGGLITR